MSAIERQSTPPVVYLDLCTIQRPLDTQSQVRIALEAQAASAILAMCINGEIELITSDALEYEMKRNTLAVRRKHAATALSLATRRVSKDEMVQQRAESFVQQGVKPLDALHVALAEAAHADYFCTCDDRLLRRIRQIADLQVTPLSPLQLVEEV